MAKLLTISLLVLFMTTGKSLRHNYIWSRWFQLGYFEINSVISNSKPFHMDLPFSRLLSATSNSRYFEQFKMVGFNFINDHKDKKTLDDMFQSRNAVLSSHLA